MKHTLENFIQETENNNLRLIQINTAGAIHLIKNEVESFINNYYKRTN